MSGGPAEWKEALEWIQEAAAQRRYILHPHASARMAQRRISIFDIRAAIASAKKCVRYPERAPTAGGTCWRITGLDVEGEETRIGVEAFRDHLGRRVLIVTVF